MNTLRNTLLFTPFLLSAAAVQAETEERALTDFDAIEIGGGIDLTLTQGAEFSVVVEAEDGDLEDLVTEVRNGTLRIHMDRSFYDRRGWNWDTDYVVSVTLPALTELEAGGGSDVRGSGTITSDELDLNASGGSDIELDVNADRLELSASGGSDMEISGTANFLEAESSGGSDLDASRLVATEVEANASGGSDLDVNVTGTLIADASGGSDIRYEGDPTERDTDTSGGGDVTHRR